MGKHANLIYIQAILRSIESTQIQLSDLYYYNYNDNSKFTGMNKYGDYMGVSNDTNPIRLINPIELPSEWEMTWTMINTRSNSAWCYPHIGESYETDKQLGVGKLSRTIAGVYKPSGQISETDNISSNMDYPMKVTYQNGTYNLVYNNHNITFTEPAFEPTYFLGFALAGYQGNGARIKDIRLKQL